MIENIISMEVIEADNLSKLIKALITERSDGICNIEAFISQFHGINVIRTKEDTTYFIAKADKKKALGLLKKYGENNQRLFVKLSPIHSRGDPGFAYERFLYRLSEHILQTHITPNIVREVMSFRCEKFVSFSNADSPVKKALNQLFENVKHGPAGLGVLITEAVDGKSLRSTVAILDAEQLSMVLFQIYYTLQEFHYLGIRHNDLHDENIILEPYLDTKQMIYVVSENEYYAFVPKYIVKILDFDLSTLTDKHSPFTNELSLGKHFCQGMCICTTPNSKFDIFTITRTIYDRIGLIAGNRFKRELQETVIPDDTLLDDKSCCKAPGRLCLGVTNVEKKVYNDFKGTIETIETANDIVPDFSRVRDFHEIITQTDFFDKYKNAKLTKASLPRSIRVQSYIKTINDALPNNNHFYISSIIQNKWREIINSFVKD